MSRGLLDNSNVQVDKFQFLLTPSEQNGASHSEYKYVYHCKPESGETGSQQLFMGQS